MSTLRARAIRGIQWNLAGTLVNAVLQYAVIIVMARLIGPAEYGVLAMAQLFMSLAGFFANFGVGVALIRKPVLRDTDIRAAFTASMAISMLFVAVMWLLAPAAAALFRVDAVAPVVRAMSWNFLLTGLGATSGALLCRSMRFKALAIGSTVSYFVGCGLVGLPLAVHGWGVWALVASMLAQSLVGTVYQFAVARHSLRPTLDRQSYREVLGYGGQHSIAGLLEFLGNSASNFVIGRWLGEAALGLFNRASSLVNLPIQILMTSISKVLFPSLSEVQQDRARMKRIFINCNIILALISFPVGLGLVPVAREFIFVMLGARWVDGWPALVGYALAVPVAFLGGVSLQVNDVIGNMRVKIAIQTCTLLCFAAAMSIGIRWGITGISASVLIGCTFRFLWATHTACRLLEISSGEYYRAVGAGFWPGVFLHGALWMTIPVFQGLDPLPRLLAAGSTGLLLAGLLLLVIRTAGLSQAVRLIIETYGPVIKRIHPLFWYLGRIAGTTK